MKLALVVAMVAGMVGCSNGPRYHKQIKVQIVGEYNWLTMCVNRDSSDAITIPWPEGETRVVAVRIQPNSDGCRDYGTAVIEPWSKVK